MLGGACMDEDKIKDILHDMRGAISVLNGFVSFVDIDDPDVVEYKEAAERGIIKLNKSIDDLTFLTE